MTEATFAQAAELPPVHLVPEWVHLFPVGPEIVGADGRRFLNDQPTAVVAAFSRPVPIDFDHGMELRAPQGVPTPAAGWVEALELRADGIWGRVAWTPRGRAAVASREWRYVSPAFIHTKEPPRILRLTSVGLTNRPNFTMTALNSRAQAAPFGALSPLEREICRRTGVAEADYYRAKG